jgi:hypothetical protein
LHIAVRRPKSALKASNGLEEPWTKTPSKTVSKIAHEWLSNQIMDDPYSGELSKSACKQHFTMVGKTAQSSQNFLKIWF